MRTRKYRKREGVQYKRKHNTLKLPSFALTAYAQTGKDSFIRDCQQGKFTMKLEKPNDCKWCIYALDSSRIGDMLTLTQKTCIRRYAFADAVKKQTHNFLDLKNCSADTFENVKDTCKFQGNKTIRKFYIEIGQEMRKINLNFWTQIVHDQIEKDQAENSNFIDIISDLRFENELLKQKTTIRLFRKSVPISMPLEDIENDSEHSMDSYTTTFLLIPLGEEDFALKHFPQYKDFLCQAFFCTNESQCLI